MQGPANCVLHTCSAQGSGVYRQHMHLWREQTCTGNCAKQSWVKGRSWQPQGTESLGGLAGVSEKTPGEGESELDQEDKGGEGPCHRERGAFLVRREWRRGGQREAGDLGELVCSQVDSETSGGEQRKRRLEESVWTWKALNAKLRGWP